MNCLGPTLAELNDDTLLEDLNIEDIILPDETAYLLANHPALHQFHTSNSNLLSTSSVPPQQLLQVQVQQQQQNSNSMHSPGIAIGNEVLYDEQSTLVRIFIFNQNLKTIFILFFEIILGKSFTWFL